MISAFFSSPVIRNEIRLKNIRANNGRIILVNIKIKHDGGNSHGNRDDLEMEKSRNWHWMWSKFYYTKKHNGYFYSFFKKCAMKNLQKLKMTYMSYTLLLKQY